MAHVGGEGITTVSTAFRVETVPNPLPGAFNHVVKPAIIHPHSEKKWVVTCGNYHSKW